MEHRGRFDLASAGFLRTRHCEKIVRALDYERIGSQARKDPHLHNAHRIADSIV